MMITGMDLSQQNPYHRLPPIFVPVLNLLALMLH